jgi:hypothetical protein
MYSLHKSILTLLKTCTKAADGMTASDIFGLLEPDEQGAIKGGSAGVSKILDVLKRRGHVAQGESVYTGKTKRAIFTWIIIEGGLVALDASDTDGLVDEDNQDLLEVIVVDQKNTTPGAEYSPAVDNQPGSADDSIVIADDFMDYGHICDELDNLRIKIKKHAVFQEKIINKINQLEYNNKLIKEQQNVTHIKEKLAVLEHCREFFVPVNTDFSDVLRDIANDLRDRAG